jgi:hypothetical protein
MILILNVTGIHNYHEANVNENDENLLLKGNITVISEANDVFTTLYSGDNNANSTSAINNVDTAEVIMVPEQAIENYVQALSKGFAVYSTYNFKDLLGGQKGTGGEQDLLVWTTSGIDLQQVISTLKVQIYHIVNNHFFHLLFPQVYIFLIGLGDDSKYLTISNLSNCNFLIRIC